MINMDLMPRRFFDDMFDDFLTTRKEQNMKCDIYEKGGDYHIEMDIPGFNKDEISVSTKDGYLTITAEKNSEDNEEDKEKNYIRRERTYGKYERTFYLGDLDEDKINASFENGMLKIVVPKKEEAKETKKMIEIK